MPWISGTVTCFDIHDTCLILGDEGQSADISCFDSSDIFESSGFIINQTLNLANDGTFIQGQLLNDSTGLFLNLMSPSLRGWTLNIDGTYIDGTYTQPRSYNPIWINYGIYSQSSDGSNWDLQGYRFREPGNPTVGRFYANMEAPMDLGTHKIQWLYRKDSSSYATAVNQVFDVKVWGNEHPNYALPPDYPSVIVQPAYLSRLPGQTAIFQLMFTGATPLPLFYQWRKAGVNLVNGGNYSGVDTDTLTITNVTATEASFYDCIVSNVLTSTIAWLVMDPP
jgi:hypothetical protein